MSMSIQATKLPMACGALALKQHEHHERQHTECCDRQGHRNRAPATTEADQWRYGRTDGDSAQSNEAAA